MSSKILKRRRNRWSKNKKSTINSFINNANHNSNDEPSTKIQIETNDITKYLSTNDNNINDLLNQIEQLKQQVHNLKQQQKSTETEDKKPLLLIKYQNESVAEKYSKNVLSFLNETFQNNDNVSYNINNKFELVEVFEQRLDININDESILTKNELEGIINIDNDNVETVDDMICLDTIPNQLNNHSDYRYNILSTENTSNSKNTLSVNNCFNCGDNNSKHSLKDCPHPKNWGRINMARKKFKDIQTMNQRYHITDNDSRFASFKPGGDLSRELRHALGLHSKEIPLHVYKMRMLGYPPGWYQELVTHNDSLSMFTDNNSTINNNHTIDKSIIFVKDSMIVEYPGFNVPLKNGMKDEYWKYKAPPIQEYQFKHNFLLFINQFNNSSSVNTINDSNHDNNIIDITSDTTEDGNDERLSVEMEIVPNTDESLSQQMDYTDNNSQDEISTCMNKNNDNRINNGHEDSNQESTDSFDNNDNNTSSSTLSNNDMKLTSTSHARTPLLSKVSTYKTLPNMEKFSKDMGPLIMFENLSDSVGTYNKMRGLLSKVRITLKSIHQNPSE